MNTVKPPPPVRRSSSATPSHYSDSNVSTIFRISHSLHSSIISAVSNMFATEKGKSGSEFFFLILYQEDCLVISIFCFKDFVEKELLLKNKIAEDTFIHLSFHLLKFSCNK